MDNNKAQRDNGNSQTHWPPLSKPPSPASEARPSLPRLPHDIEPQILQPYRTVHQQNINSAKRRGEQNNQISSQPREKRKMPGRDTPSKTTRKATRKSSDLSDRYSPKLAKLNVPNEPMQPRPSIRETQQQWPYTSVGLFDSATHSSPRIPSLPRPLREYSGYRQTGEDPVPHSRSPRLGDLPDAHPSTTTALLATGGRSGSNSKTHRNLSSAKKTKPLPPLYHQPPDQVYLHKRKNSDKGEPDLHGPSKYQEDIQMQTSSHIPQQLPPISQQVPPQLPLHMQPAYFPSPIVPNSIYESPRQSDLPRLSGIPPSRGQNFGTPYAHQNSLPPLYRETANEADINEHVQLPAVRSVGFPKNYYNDGSSHEIAGHVDESHRGRGHIGGSQAGGGTNVLVTPSNAHNFSSVASTIAASTGNIAAHGHEHSGYSMDYHNIDSEYSEQYYDMPVMYEQYPPYSGGTSTEVSSNEGTLNSSNGDRSFSRRDIIGPTTRGRGRRKTHGNHRKGSTRSFEALSSGPLPISLITPSSSFMPTGSGTVEVLKRPPGGWFWALLSTKDQDLDIDEISESTSLEELHSEEIAPVSIQEKMGNAIYDSENPGNESNQNIMKGEQRQAEISERGLERAGFEERNTKQINDEVADTHDSEISSGSSSSCSDDEADDNRNRKGEVSEAGSVGNDGMGFDGESDASMYGLSDDDSDYHESPIAIERSPDLPPEPSEPSSRASRRQQRKLRRQGKTEPIPPITIPIQLTQPPLCNVIPAYPQALEADPVPRTRKQSKYTPEQDQKILDMKNNGCTWAEIAASTGCHNQLAARNRYQVLIGQQGGGTYAWGNEDCAQLQVILDEGEREKWFFVAEELSRKFERKFTFEVVYYKICKMFSKRPEKFGVLKTKDSTKGGAPFKRKELFDREKEDREQEQRLRALRDALTQRTCSPHSPTYLKNCTKEVSSMPRGLWKPTGTEDPDKEGNSEHEALQK